MTKWDLPQKYIRNTRQMRREIHSGTLRGVWHVDQMAACPHPPERMDVLSWGIVGHNGLEEEEPRVMVRTS